MHVRPNLDVEPRQILLRALTFPSLILFLSPLAVIEHFVHPDRAHIDGLNLLTYLVMTMTFTAAFLCEPFTGESLFAIERIDPEME